MVLQPAVEDAVVRQGAEDEVQRGGTQLGDEQDRYALAVDVVARPQRRRGGGGGAQEVVRIGRVG